MDILEESIKHDKEVAAAAAPAGPEQPKFSDILNKPEDQTRFTKMLEQGDLLRAEGLDPGVIIDLLAQPETVAPGDIAKLARAQEIYGEQVAHAKEIAETVTEGNIDDLATSSPELQNAIKVRGAKQMTAFIQKQLSELAISDPVRFEEMRTDQNALAAWQATESARLKGEFEKICKQRHIEPDTSTIVRILNDPNPHTRTQELRAEINSQLGFWRGLFTSEKTFKEFQALGGDIQTAKTEIQRRTEGVGNLMGLMLEENLEVRRALMLEIVGKNPERAPQMPLKDLYTILTTEIQMDADWQNHKMTIRNWGRMSEYDKDLERAHFEEEYQETMRQRVAAKGTGMWAAFALFLFGGALKTKRFK